MLQGDLKGLLRSRDSWDDGERSLPLTPRSPSPTFSPTASPKRQCAERPNPHPNPNPSPSSSPNPNPIPTPHLVDELHDRVEVEQEGDGEARPPWDVKERHLVRLA